MLNYIILGMIFDCTASGYDIKKYIQKGIGIFYKASYGSIYPTLKKLTEDGLVTVTEEEQGARQKKLYTITAKGQQIFLKWLSEPISPEEGNGNNSHLARVYFYDKLPYETVKQQLLDYELNNTIYLRKLLLLKDNFQSPEIQGKYYYKISTLYYGIAILQETIRWCQFIRGREPFENFLNKGGLKNE